MSNRTVYEFASELRKSPESLVEQFRCAGVEKSGPDDLVTEADKYALLRFLKASHGAGEGGRKKITLVKRGADKNVKPDPEAVDRKQAQESIEELHRDLLERSVEVTVRGGQRTLLIREDNGDLALLAPPGECLNFDPPRKIVLVSAYLSDVLSILRGDRLESVVTVPRALGKVLKSYLRAIADRAVPASQRGLCSQSGRTRQANLIGAANDLIRFEHIFPACAATVSLA
ncbi:hypothetical protein J7E49_04895 [Variovorax paradoxus]|nr:hypothetical protein [Variovorax paradoxus]